MKLSFLWLANIRGDPENFKNPSFFGFFHWISHCGWIDHEHQVLSCHKMALSGERLIIPIELGLIKIEGQDFVTYSMTFCRDKGTKAEMLSTIVDKDNVGAL